MPRRRALIAVLLLLTACGEEKTSAPPGPALDAHIAALSDPSPAVREGGATALAKGWPASARAVPVLVLALDDEAEGVRRAAGTALVTLADRGAPVVIRALATSAAGEDEGLLLVLETFSALGGAAGPADIATALFSGPAQYMRGKRHSAVPVTVEDIRRGGAVAAALVPRTSDRLRSEVRRRESNTLLVAWLPARDADDERVRERAATALALLGGAAARGSSIADALPPPDVPPADRASLLRLLSPPATARSHDRVATFAPRVVTRLGLRGDDVVAALRENHARTHGWLALEALASIGAEAMPALDPHQGTAQFAEFLRAGREADVRRVLASDVPRERSAAAWALAADGVFDDGVLESLLQSVETGDSEGAYVLDLIGDFRGSKALEALPRLRRIDASADPDLADAIALAAARLGPSDFDLASTWGAWKSAKGRTVGSESWFEWPRAFARAVETSSDPSRLAALLQVLDPGGTHDPTLAGSVCVALPRLGSKADVAVPALLGWLDAVDRWMKASAKPEALALEHLKEFAIGASRADSSTASNSLDLPYHLRASAVDALGLIGPAAKDAVPALESLRSSTDERIRHLAARALRRIRAK